MEKIYLMLRLLFLSLIFVSRSGSSGGGGVIEQREEDTGDKNLFSVWRQVDEGNVLDFRNLAFNTDFIFEFSNSEGVCTCNLEIDGSQSSGDILISDCVGIQGCFEFVDAYSINKDADSLRICDSRRDCDEFR